MNDLYTAAKLLDTIAQNWSDVITARAALYLHTFRSGNKLLFAGNGGSAAICSHIAGEYVGRFQRPGRPALPAIALASDLAVLTALANDFGYANCFDRPIRALAAPGDLVVLHSTSGHSPNLLTAATVAVEATGRWPLALLGRGGGPLADRIGRDRCLIVPSDDPARIQEAHLAIEHTICRMVEERV